MATVPILVGIVGGRCVGSLGGRATSGCFLGATIVGSIEWRPWCPTGVRATTGSLLGFLVSCRDLVRVTNGCLLSPTVVAEVVKFLQQDCHTPDLG